MTYAKTEEMVAAIAYDYAAGKIDTAQVQAYLAMVDRNLRTEEQNIQKDEMALRVELREHAARRLGIRRAARQESVTQ